jgi:universal stress protein F
MFKTILVPIDMAHVAEGKANIEIAAQHADAGAKIILLNVVEDIPNWAAAELPTNLQENTLKKAQAELQAIANASGRELDIEVQSGRSYKTILEVADQRQVDMIIIASHRPGLQDYFLGSTAAKVVRHATCSVLVIR